MRRRSTRAKGATARARSPARLPKYRRAARDDVEAAARRLLGRGQGPYDSQLAFRRALLRELHRRDPLLAVGPRRLRRLLLDAGAVRFKVAYAERPNRQPLSRCPVCGEELKPIRNQTLWNDRVVLGYRCARCGYWTHLARRVPTRYTVLPATGRRD